MMQFNYSSSEVKRNREVTFKILIVQMESSRQARTIIRFFLTGCAVCVSIVASLYKALIRMVGTGSFDFAQDLQELV